MPILNVTSDGPKVVDGKTPLEFSIEYEFNEDIPAYLGVYANLHGRISVCGLRRRFPYRALHVAAGVW